MKADQILYTSCKRGIAGETSGFQTFSYSQRIAEWEGNNQLGILFAQFNGSTMPTGLPILPTEQEAQSLFPKRYSYRRLDGRDGLCGLALCTYIGRDYPEDSQRAGNFLGHAFIFPETACDTNPGLFIGSPSLLPRIDPSVVRKDERPALLSTEEIIPADACSIDAVRDFLCEDYRADMFKQMLACLLNGKDEQYNRVKHIFINDTPANIRLWIASLMLAFPTRTALGISFSTYEFDPENSQANIIGVLKETNYNSAKNAMGVDYYFDFIDSVFDNTEFPELNDFCDFVCDSMMYSYENLQAFHDFVGQFTYVAVDKEFKDAHNLSLISQGVLSFDDFSVEQVSDFLSFALKYANKDFNCDLSKRVFEYLHRADIADELFNVLIDFPNALSETSTIAASSINREFTEICSEHFCNADVGFSAFSKIYDRFEKKAGISLRTQFLSYLQEMDVKSWHKPGYVWRPAFIIWLCASDRKAVQELVNRDSFQYYILEIVLRTLASNESESISTIKYLFAEYKKAGADVLTVLYVAVRLSSSQSAASNWIDAYRTALASFPEADVVSSLQMLYKSKIEDDINYLVDAAARDSSRDFILFAKLLDKQLPSYFSFHKQNLIAVCFKRASSLSANYKIFVFAVETDKFSDRELEQILEKAVEKIAVTKIPESHNEYIEGFCTYCKKLRLPIPQRVALADLNLYLQDLCKSASKLFSSEKKLTKNVKELMQSSTLRIEDLDLDEKRAYLIEVARSVSVLMQKSLELELQDELFNLDAQTQEFFSCEVLKQACVIAKKSHDYEPLIYLIIYDAFSSQSLSRRIVDIINKSNINPSSLKKCVEKEKAAEEFAKYYNSFNVRGSESFTGFINRLINAIEPAGGSSIVDGVLGFFKKNKED
jgi:hypothetical protein